MSVLRAEGLRKSYRRRAVVDDVAVELADSQGDHLQAVAAGAAAGADEQLGKLIGGAGEQPVDRVDRFRGGFQEQAQLPVAVARAPAKPVVFDRQAGVSRGQQGRVFRNPQDAAAVAGDDPAGA